MYKTIQQARTIERNLAGAVLELTKDTNDLIESELRCRIDKNNHIVISIDDNTNKSPRTFDDAMRETIIIIKFIYGKPIIVTGEKYIINDKSGKPRDWKTPFLKAMQQFADSLSLLE